MCCKFVKSDCQFGPFDVEALFPKFSYFYIAVALFVTTKQRILM